MGLRHDDPSYSPGGANVCGVCVRVQAFVRTSAMNATRRSHSDVRSSRTVAKFTAESSTSRTNSDEIRSVSQSVSHSVSPLVSRNVRRILVSGSQCPLAACGEENFENLTTKRCILKYI